MSDNLWQVLITTDRETGGLASDLLSEIVEPVALSVSFFEVDEAQDLWSVEAHYADRPDGSMLESVLSDLGQFSISIKLLKDRDWVTLSQETQKPVEAGRFYIHATHHSPPTDPSLIPIRIEAGQAFGTGHHGTTQGCLEAIGTCLKESTIYNALDLGCGTGVLAMALAKISAADLIASDIDPIAIETARQVAMDNNLVNRVRFVTAKGFHHDEILSRAPYDLIIANILAKPLIGLAKEFSHYVSDGGRVILSGLLITQERRVQSAFSMNGFRLLRRRHIDEWSTLTLAK